MLVVLRFCLLMPNVFFDPPTPTFWGDPRTCKMEPQGFAPHYFEWGSFGWAGRWHAYWIAETLLMHAGKGRQDACACAASTDALIKSMVRIVDRQTPCACHVVLTFRSVSFHSRR